MQTTIEEIPTVHGQPLASPSIGDIEATHRFAMPRMFRNEFLEFFSKVHPAVPAAMYVPVTAFFAWRSVATAGALVAAATLFAGFMLWTLAEYLLHRFYFHIPPTTPVRKWLYFYSHGIHHQYPDDFYRLVMPPLLSAVPAAIFYAAFRATLPAAWVPGLFAGFAAGYLYYDYVHFATHHVKPPRAAWLSPIANVMKEQRRRHMKHHFQDHTKGFGVSMPLWDHVFGTHEGH
ncbi:MAG: fatty acid hydroxylase [Myxococcaceae bacterium]|nr:fatty acid hydroxylase [Myxococcaceae bacterium]